MPRLPPFHTTATYPRTNTLNATPTILIEFRNLQHSRPQLRGTHGAIKNLLVCLQRCWASPSTRSAIQPSTGVGACCSKDKTVGLVELHLAEFHESSDRDLEGFWGQSRTRRETSVHQRIQPPPRRHVVRHRQRRRQVLLDKEVEDLIRVRSWSSEDFFSECLGGTQLLKRLWVRITDDLKQPRSDGGHLVLCCDPEEG